MMIIGWMMSGLIASSIISLSYPEQKLGNTVQLLVLAVFLLLGGIDYIASAMFRHRRRSIKFR